MPGLVERQIDQMQPAFSGRVTVDPREDQLAAPDGQDLV